MPKHNCSWCNGTGIADQSMLQIHNYRGPCLCVQSLPSHFAYYKAEIDPSDPESDLFVLTRKDDAPEFLDIYTGEPLDFRVIVRMKDGVASLSCTSNNKVTGPRVWTGKSIIDAMEAGIEWLDFRFKTSEEEAA